LKFLRKFLGGIPSNSTEFLGITAGIIQLLPPCGFIPSRNVKEFKGNSCFDNGKEFPVPPGM
jgi:hypothetical protein